MLTRLGVQRKASVNLVIISVSSKRWLVSWKSFSSVDPFEGLRPENKYIVQNLGTYVRLINKFRLFV